MTFEQLLTKIRTNTDMNHHTENLILVADYYGYKYLSTIFNAILVCQKADGCINSYLKAYRQERKRDLFNAISDDFAEEFKQLDRII